MTSAAHIISHIPRMVRLRDEMHRLRFGAMVASRVLEVSLGEAVCELRNNDFVGAIQDSALMPSLLEMTMALNVKFGPWQSANYFVGLRSLVAVVTRS